MSLTLSLPRCAETASFIPRPPQDAYYDSTRTAWVLSRYGDVQAALRERALHQASPRGETFPAGEDEVQRAETFAQVRAEIAELHRGRWRADMESEAGAVLRDVDRKKRVDLLGDVALPWAVDLLMKMSGASESRRFVVGQIAATLLYKKALSLDLDEDAKPRWLRAAGDQWLKVLDPEKTLDGLTARGDLALSKMMFLAVAQSLPAFLAKAWLALMLHPDQMQMLAANTRVMPQAAAELLRYAGIVHTLHRKAAQDVRIGSARIAEGERVELEIACANFDPERFREPRRLDLFRPIQSHVSLGGGLHACAGGALVRQAVIATTEAFLSAKPRLLDDQPLVWMGDSTLRWPLAVWVR
jgi:cytochrome P450